MGFFGTWHNNVNDLKQNFFWLNFCDFIVFFVMLLGFFLFFCSFLFYKYQRVTKQLPTAVKKTNYFFVFFFFFFIGLGCFRLFFVPAFSRKFWCFSASSSSSFSWLSSSSSSSFSGTSFFGSFFPFRWFRAQLRIGRVRTSRLSWPAGGRRRAVGAVRVLGRTPLLQQSLPLWLNASGCCRGGGLGTALFFEGCFQCPHVGLLF